MFSIMGLTQIVKNVNIELTKRLIGKGGTLIEDNLHKW